MATRQTNVLPVRQDTIRKGRIHLYVICAQGATMQTVALLKMAMFILVHASHAQEGVMAHEMQRKIRTRVVGTAQQDCSLRKNTRHQRKNATGAPLDAGVMLQV